MSSETVSRLSSSGIERKGLCYVNPAQDGEIKPRKREITDAVKDCTWENYARKHLEIWHYLTRTKPMEELYSHQSEYMDGIFSLLIDEVSK